MQNGNYTTYSSPVRRGTGAAGSSGGGGACWRCWSSSW